MTSLDDKITNMENRLQDLERYSKVDVSQSFPVGSVYTTISGVSSYNPANLLGFGTWSYCGVVLADDSGTPCAVYFWERTA